MMSDFSTRPRVFPTFLMIGPESTATRRSNFFLVVWLVIKIFLLTLKLLKNIRNYSKTLYKMY